MPGGDGTGPRGTGAMTGRGSGFCRGTDRAGFANRRFGRGFGGGGRGGRNWAPNPQPGSEKEALQDQARQLQSELDSIKRRLGDIDPSKE